MIHHIKRIATGGWFCCHSHETGRMDVGYAPPGSTVSYSQGHIELFLTEADLRAHAEAVMGAEWYAAHRPEKTGQDLPVEDTSTVDPVSNMT